MRINLASSKLDCEQVAGARVCCARAGAQSSLGPLILRSPAGSPQCASASVGLVACEARARQVLSRARR